MNYAKLVVGFLSVCAVCVVTASVASAQDRADVSCSSEDDGVIQLVLLKDANGNFAGTSAPFSLNPGLKIYFDIQGLSRVAPNSRLRAAGINIAGVASATGQWQAGAGFTTLFDRFGRAGVTLLSLAGILDPEGINCHVQLR